MKSFPPKKVISYCNKNSYGEPFHQEGRWWAFPPHAVIPVPLPIRTSPNRKLGLVAAQAFSAISSLSLVYLTISAGDDWVPLKSYVASFHAFAFLYMMGRILQSTRDRRERRAMIAVLLTYILAIATCLSSGTLEPDIVVPGIISGTATAIARVCIERFQRR